MGKPARSHKADKNPLKIIGLPVNTKSRDVHRKLYRICRSCEQVMVSACNRVLAKRVQAVTGLLGALLAAEAVHCFDHRGDRFRRGKLRDAMAQIEHMAVAI